MFVVPALIAHPRRPGFENSKLRLASSAVRHHTQRAVVCVHVQFENRDAAGAALGERLKQFLGTSDIDLEDVLVLALPRGGVPIGEQVARLLGRPLSILSVRKIGAPNNPELAIGAVAADGTRLFGTLTKQEVTSGYLKRATQEAWEAARRREKLLTEGIDCPRAEEALKGKVACITDDGIATGLTAAVAAQSARRHGARRVLLAAPVIPADTKARLSEFADAVVAVESPVQFSAVGQFYEDFSEVTDEQARRLLKEAQAGGGS